MLAEISPKILIASPDPSLLLAITPVLHATGARLEIADCGKSALVVMVKAPLPMMALIDGELPQAEIERLLAAVHATTGAHVYPIVLLSDTVAEEWRRRLDEGVLDDIVPRSYANPHWQFRLDYVLRNCDRLRELERLCETSQMTTQFDSLTGLPNRSALLSTLFRETDRVQRSKTALSLVQFAIDDSDHWKSQLGGDAWNGLLRTVVDRCRHLLRSYDTLGRIGDHEFLMVLPGCSSINATMLAERIRMDVFSDPIVLDGESVRLTASYGIASSHGRSPMVVLREAEMALHGARASGPESIQCFVGRPDPQMDPIGFLS